MIDPIIKTENLGIAYNLGKSNEYIAIRGVDIEIFPHEYVALFGPSGCGKSTMLYCFLGVLAHTSGRLIIKDQDPYSLKIEDMVKFQQLTVGIIFQAFYLINSINLIDNVALPQIFMGVSPTKREKRAKELLTRFGLANHMKKYPTALSGGQIQRVSVSRALVNNPEILLADEPTGNLDSIATQQVMDALEEVNNKDKKTIILITHNARQLAYCHRVYYMKDGYVEREVVNPEKKQIKRAETGKMLVTELEDLARIYPYLPQDDLKTKSIINYLTQDLTFDQLERLEKYVKALVTGNMSEERFSSLLPASFSDGGVGLHESRAAEMSEKAKLILRESIDIKRFRRIVDESTYFTKQKELIAKLRKYLLERCEVDLNPIQTARLEKVIAERVTGEIRKPQLEERIDAPMDQGGVGLSKRTTRNMVMYLEKILALSVAEK